MIFPVCSIQKDVSFKKPHERGRREVVAEIGMRGLRAKRRGAVRMTRETAQACSVVRGPKRERREDMMKGKTQPARDLPAQIVP